MPPANMFLAALLAAGLGPAAPAAAQGDHPADEVERKVDALTIRRKLNYAAWKSPGRTRAVANAILLYWSGATRYSENAAGEWIVANKGGVMVNGRAYDALPGSVVKVAMSRDGTWLASGDGVFLHSGQRFDDPELADQVQRDMLAFQTMAFGRSSPANQPLRAGPSLPPQTRPGLVTAPGTSVTRLIQQQPEVEFALSDPNSQRLDLTVGLDTEAPFPTRVVVTRNPDDQVQRRSGFPPRFFVGGTAVEFEILMSERMAEPPRVEVEQADGTRVPANLSEDNNPFFRYRWFPFLSPGANGPARLEILGDTDNSPPEFGTDLAGNPIQPVEGFSIFSQGLVVDTLPPELRRTDGGDPGDISLIPGQDELLAGHEFPRSILAFVDDYDQPGDPSGGGPFSTQDASGVDFRRIGDGSGLVDMKLFTPSGQEILGTLSSRISALELFLPDVYDVSLGIFPDTDNDGRADPEEGTYRVQLSLVDEVGNSSSESRPFGLDATPIAASALRVAIRPILSDPFPNPPDPLPQDGSPVFVRRLDAVEVTSPDEQFSFTRSTVRVEQLIDRRSFPRDLVGDVRREDDRLVFDIARDQDGDGQDDFENPPPGAFLPPGVTDPRLGRNDGLYRVVVDAFDRAGNPSTITRDFTLDTTPPMVGSAFPMENTTQTGPLRMVDVQLTDPQARSGADGSGIRLTASNIGLQFLGNEQTPAQPIRTLAFIHEPNPDDPTQPDFNPIDVNPRLLLEIIDEEGMVTSLPIDGSFDGVYQLDVVVRDRAGNEAMGTTTFNYIGIPPEDPEEMPEPTPIQLALVRP